MSPKTNLAEISPSPFLEMVAGGTKGKVYDLAAARMTVGRSEDNDIVIQSEAVSRYHATFERDDDGRWVVRDHESKNGVQVNGKSVEMCELQHGDLVQVGNFVFRFTDSEVVSAAEGEVPGVELGEGVEPRFLESPLPVRTRRPKVNKRVLIYSVVALLLILLYVSSQEGGNSGVGTSDSQPKDGIEKTALEKSKEAHDFKVSPQSDIQDDSKFDNSKKEGGTSKLRGLEDPLLKDAEINVSKNDYGNSPLMKADQSFRQGQREYLNGNYGRAIESFQTAITFHRRHELAEKYLRLAVYEAEDAAKKHMNIGVQYFEALNYQRAIYHFTEVVSLMAHRPTEQLVGDAEKYIALCRKLLMAAEQFP